MKAELFYKNTAPDNLVCCDIDKPVPKDNEVLIKIHAVPLKAADYRSMRMGLIPKGKIFGADIAGRVESVGKNISMFRPDIKII